MPSTLKQTVDRVKAAKTEIANAITTKGGTVSSGDGLEEFAADIMSIKNDLTSIDITENGTYYSGDETVVTSSTFPVVVNDSNGTPVRHADIDGNTVQSGTPASDNPIMPQGTGERTGNLFDKNAKNVNNGYISGYYLYPDNTPVAPSSGIVWNTSEYIEITSGTIALSTLSTTSSGTPAICFYDSSKNYIIGYSYDNGEVRIHDVPSGAKYCRISIDERVINQLMLNLGSTALPYEPYGCKLDISSGGKNLFDKDSAQYSTVGYMREDGTFGENNNYGVSGYIQLSPDTQYTVSDMNINGLYPAICFYTENKTFISGIKYNGLTMLSFTTPINCKYALMSYLKSNVNNIMFNKGSTPLPYEPYNRTTTPIYLGEVPTTRKIKKLVLTGRENWVVWNLPSSYSVERYLISVTNVYSSIGICSHFTLNQTNTDLEHFRFGGENWSELLIFIKKETAPTSTALKSYLAQQYAAGTPVTVWYVLAEPETTVVNEPLMKIDDYVDSLSVDVELPLLQNTQNNIDVNTTLKPSSASFTYNRLSEYIGYNEINVDVSNTYTAEDEGKVVNNATLVPQTVMSTEITVNGTYDTTLYNSIVVNVPDIVGHTFIVATIPNAVVTVTNTSNTYTATADNVGEALFKSVAAGTYDVTAAYDDAVSDTTSITIADHTVTEDSFATLTISASTNTAITVTDGTVTKTLTYTGTPIVQYVSLGTWDLSCTIDDTVITRIVLVDSYTNQNIRLAPPSQTISRYVDFTTNTTTITGDPNTHPVYMGINRCNVSDNGTINAYYGDASYVEDGSNGQVMVKIPKFYYKVTPDEDGGLNGVNIRKCTWEISETPADGFTLHPAFYDANGNEIDCFLYGAFDGVGQRDSAYGTSYNTSTDKLSSVAGSSYLPTNSLTRATARTMATNRGTGWYSAGVKQTMAVLMLFAVEYGFNSQIAVGQGVVSASAATYAGQTTGNITSGTQDNKTTPVNWRGIENLWGNIFDWIDGLNINNRIPYFCNSYTFADDTATGYTQIGFNLPSSNNFISALGYDSNNDWIMLPSEASGASATSAIGDYCYSNSGWRVARLGGDWYVDSYAGSFCWACNANSSNANANFGARVMFIPTAA